MSRKPQPWRREELTETAQPQEHFKVKSYPDAIGWNGDPAHPDPRIRERMIAIDPLVEAVKKMLGAWDRQGSPSAANIPVSDEDYHGNPMILGTRNFVLKWRGRGSKAGSSHSLECQKCGNLMDVRQAEIVDDPMSPTGTNYQHKQFALGGCVENLDRTPYGPSRRALDQ